jgi:uncharacterized protein
MKFKISSLFLALCMGMGAFPTGVQAQHMHGPGTILIKSPWHYFKDPLALKLLAAARAGDLLAAKAAIAEGASPNEEGPMDNQINRMRLLHYAVAAKDANAVRTLIELGADPAMDTLALGSPLVFVVYMNQVDMLKTILDAKPVASLPKETQTTLLFNAVKLGRPECIDVFLSKGMSPDLRDPQGFTPMMRALGLLDLPMAIDFLNRGASLDVQTPNGVTPANQLQFLFDRQENNPELNIGILADELTELKFLMLSQGVKFPTPKPSDLRKEKPL